MLDATHGTFVPETKFFLKYLVKWKENVDKCFRYLIILCVFLKSNIIFHILYKNLFSNQFKPISASSITLKGYIIQNIQRKMYLAIVCALLSTSMVSRSNKTCYPFTAAVSGLYVIKCFYFIIGFCRNITEQCMSSFYILS